MKNQTAMWGGRDRNPREWGCHVPVQPDKRLRVVLPGLTSSVFIRRTAFTLAVSIFSLTGCMTPAEKVEAAEYNVQSAKSQLVDAKAAYQMEFEAYRQETVAMIASNDKLIAAFTFRIASEKNDNTRANYHILVNHLKIRNEKICKQMDHYEMKGKSNWKGIITELNQDGEEF